MPDDSWTVETLRIHLEQELADLMRLLDERQAANVKAMKEALGSAEKAVAKAEAANDKRFDAVNELRAQLAEQAAASLSRTEAGVRIDAIAYKLDQHVDGANNRLAEMTKRLDLNQGKAQGKEASWVVIVGTAGLVASIVAILAFLLTRV
jgi:multidrug resistance efflux pump